ncbi:Mcp5-PH domain-containing protein [Fusarium falciforme]|uniref:Mcp5-PH domain-containing protein n=1 Tax=Fusarium falciforme TaxID=195108 RepID=UPI0023018BEE|nr:Mcp5-PH domain-containing protein [Fusarium falciforme]WAO89692.1 Mcp5-PH domain-containing protein [Fusarium falciforme]
MGVWETDDEYLSGPAATSLPTPHDTPYRTPSRTSRKSRRSVTPPGKGVSPPPLLSDMASKRSSRDVTTDESISILDPRRFTPTLHANLVSEILALRRDQEEKFKQIEILETSLHAAKEERETLRQDLTETGKESRSLKRQLSLLEGGTSSALGELARERDDAVESVSDTRKRLEAAQKKIRSQEEDSQRVHELWAQEKDGWEDERRKFERRIHVAESRLKTILDEVAAYQQAQMNNAANNGTGPGHESEVEESGRENDAASVRTMSMTNSVRFSIMSGPGMAKLNGNSLADELNFDDDEDEMSDLDGRESAMSNHATSFHVRNFSRDSVLHRLHGRNQSLESIKRPGSVARGRLFKNQAVLEALEGEDGEDEEEQHPPAPKVSYTDTGIQYSPPPSPKLPPAKPATPEPPVRAKSPEVECSPRADGEIEANQRRKRVHINRPLSIEPPTPRRLMVSAAAQTMEEPLTPPKTPKSPTRPPPPPPPPVVEPPVEKKPVMITSSTQTDALPVREPSPVPPPSPPPLAIPSISVHPPTSRPNTPREPRLPQYFKDFGCQVNLSSPVSTTEAGVQTEGIQTDKRLALLPAHLQPSAISSRPSSPNPSPVNESAKNFTPVPGNVPPRNPRRLTTKRSLSDLPSSPISVADDDTLHDAYPGNNDDGPLSSQRAPVRRPHRFSSLFAGFDGGSSDEADEFGDVEMSDSEYRTALSAPRPKSISSRPGKRSSTGTTGTNGTIPTSPEQITMRQGPRVAAELHQAYRNADKDGMGRMSSSKSGRAYEKGPASMSSNRASVMRKAAMIQNGIASHQGRSRSPSLPESNNPPFPIPTRASSRKLPFSASAPSDGQRSPTRGDTFQRRGSGRVYRASSIRKVRSAAALPRNQRHRRQGSRSPPPLSPSTEAPESPSLPPLPRNDITTPRTRVRHSGQFRHQHKLSTNTDNTFNTFNTFNTSNTANTGSTDPPPFMSSSAQSTGVVDAIAQAMVGEWMFKYVRRRKSFGVPESNGKDDTGNDRHKRWVWLAPYERAILWSSKQPSSGSALMGKTGRKLTIQSVLDVKDDNAAPKGMAPVFNRSILILTPQRALKFTAVSADRHYIWLTALSFLAHSSQAVPEIISAPPPIQQTPLPEFEAPRSKMKRGGIRDSIRLAKGRTAAPRPGPPSIPSIPSIPSAPSSQMGDVTSFPIAESVGGFSSSVGGFSSNHSRDDSRDAAEPPFIPRFHERNQAMVHGRKRSNTGGHVPPPLSFRGFSGPIGGVGQHQATNSTAGNSTGTAGSSDIYQASSTGTGTGTGTWGMSQAGSGTGTWGMSQAGSGRTSEASSRPSNFFDAIGTVRMEAFISPLAFSQFSDYPDENDEFRHSLRRRSKEQRRRQSRSRHRDSYHSRGNRAGFDDYYHGSRTAGEEDYFRDDPFKGF